MRTLGNIYLLDTRNININLVEHLLKILYNKLKHVERKVDC